MGLNKKKKNDVQKNIEKRKDGKVETAKENIGGTVQGAQKLSREGHRPGGGVAKQKMRTRLRRGYKFKAKG